MWGGKLRGGAAGGKTGLRFARQLGKQPPAVQSLRDKLLKAGLVSAQQAERVDAEQRAASRPRSMPAPATQPEPPRPLDPKAKQRLSALEQRQLDRTLRELARGGEVPRQEGERTFHFQTRKAKLRRIDLADAQAKKLEEGELAIVECPEPAQIEHILVSAATAEQMAKISDKAVRFWNRPGAPIGFDSD
jgi:uncharacterized protein YaiL (DUF2058 family)